MAYYKIQIEVWCNFDPQSTSLDEIVENTHTGEAVCTRQEVVSEEGDAEQSQG